MSTQKAHTLSRCCVGSIAVLNEVPVKESSKKINIINTGNVPEMQSCVENVDSSICVCKTAQAKNAFRPKV